MSELGNTFSQARIDRGLTLEDCERDTRISKRYLNALEREDWKVFPAPVYSRAFLRTYAQYLGLSPDEMMRLFQESTAEPELPKPLPELRAAGTAVGSMNWPLAGVVLLFLVVAGFFVYRSSSGDDAETAKALPTATVAPEFQGGASNDAAPGRDPGPITKGEVPDLRGVRLDEAIGALAEAGLSYLVVEPEGAEGQAGIVLSQEPAGGTEGRGDTAVTLVVPR